jgi:hypothetical protein
MMTNMRNVPLAERTSVGGRNVPPWEIELPAFYRHLPPKFPDGQPLLLLNVSANPTFVAFLEHFNRLADKEWPLPASDSRDMG